MVQGRWHSKKRHGIVRQSHNGVSWRVNSHGAYLETLIVDRRRLLYPVTEIDGKRRGGLFPTVPQFGADNREVAIQQPQHGYGRVANWVITQISPQTVNLQHTQREGEYAGLTTFTGYKIERRQNSLALIVSLVLFHEGDSELRVAPGEHPYIDISRLSADERELITRNIMNAPQTVPAKQLTIGVAPNVELAVSTDGFDHMTCWTASKDYMCIEPSVAGPSFSDATNRPNQKELILPGEQRKYHMELQWKKT